MIKHLVDDLSRALAKKGYSFFQEGDYNLNLIGVRSVSNVPGAFDDLLFCLYRVDGVWRAHIWPITTDPGTHYLKQPINPHGTAILVPGQYRGAYTLGSHKGYSALVQHGAPVKVWRDSNRDSVLDWGSGDGESGWYGINIHRAKPRGVSPSASYYSAGCQVFAVKEEHDALMAIARVSAAKYGDKFTYTLLDHGDL